MTWPTNKQNVANSWDTDIQPIIDLFTGVSGGGDQVQITQYNNSTNYAVTIRNLDTTNGRGLKVTDAADSVLLTCAKNAIALGASTSDIITAAGLIRLPNGAVTAPALSFTNDSDCGLYRIGTNNLGISVNQAKVLDVSTTGLGVTGTLTASGTAYIGDTANASVTLGLTINQGGADDEALALKSSDVAHGVTNWTETDTYFSIRKVSEIGGGALIYGFSDADNDTYQAVQLVACLGAAAGDTSKSTSGVGIVHIRTALKSGVDIGAAGANENLLTLANSATTRYIWDAEGSFHADVESTTYDQYDDVALLNALDSEFQRRQGNVVGREFGTWLAEHKAILQREKIANFYDPDGPRVMVNFTRLAMLHTGAIRQLSQRLQIAEQRLAALPSGN